MISSSGSSRTADVVVIGGGIIGCSIALRLAQAKLKVCVLDRGTPGAEASSAAAGMLAPQGETVSPDAFFDLGAASRDLYPNFVAEIEELSGQDVGYRRDGELLVARDDEEGRALDEIYEGQTNYGLPLEKLSGNDVRRHVPGASPEIRSGLFVAGDHRLDNERLARAIVEACRRLGVTFCAQTAVTRIIVDSRLRGNDRPAGRVESVEARAGAGGASLIFRGDRFVLSAGSWSGELMAPLGVSLPLKPCRGQMIEFEAPGELPHVMRAGHHYLVPRVNRRVLAGTTAEYVGFEKEVTGEGLRSIIEGVSKIFPKVKEFRFRRAWAGFRPDTPDHLPILGLGNYENLVFATGHFRNGILMAPITAQLISELILSGSTSRPIEAYRPSRFA
jgi:glycine oxidase